MSRGRTSAAVVFALLLSSLAAAFAEDASPNATNDKGASTCDRFAWPIAREKAWFEAKLLPTPSGARAAEDAQGILLVLTPTKKFDFFLAPERQPRPDSFSGDVFIGGVPAPGLYQVTLSDEAWIDVFENGTRLKSTAFTGVKDCPGVRKSVRFELTPGAPVTIQITNSAKDQIKVAIAPAS